MSLNIYIGLFCIVVGLVFVRLDDRDNLGWMYILLGFIDVILGIV